MQRARSQLLQEGLLQRFLRYVQVDSPSAEGAADVPSTPEQWEMARLLFGELQALGLSGVTLSEHGIVTATLPGPAGAPVVGLLAHYDTFPGVPGKGVRPLVHRRYAGGDIPLPAGPVLSPRDHPALARCIGQDVITSDGSTLLGADDKAGVAEVMEVLCRLIREPGRPRPTVRVAFTPDEETGRGIGYLDVATWGCTAAYTLDGSEPGEISGENFDAANGLVVIEGRSSHTGTARGKLINAVRLAAELVTSVPATLLPETTEGREGFIHVDAIEGNMERVTLKIALREFTLEGLGRLRTLVEEACRGLELRYPGSRARFEVTGGYANMARKLEERPEVMELAREAVRRAGLEVIERPIRGGTDGARLTEQGLPTPNLFTGGMNYHSRTEWACAQWMEQAVDVVLRLLELWATRQ
ncbi:peptidase T [Carboxydochorda subterranea]|uniref:Peptidase T n=1 Tax=Carboxydichorda subterranea TaxID=3109565 RepID=A0ABZ1BY19_9FIRM|nr:peptidase T [Limnochorda sp. L945t]WRP17644.1 peptidase T [Limnochorda sp. L945t]